MTIRKMYSEDSLNAVFRTASDRALSDEGFAEFQRRHLKQAFPAFDYDRSTTSLIETQHETQTVSVESILMNFEASLEEVMASYMGAVDHDFLAKIVYANPGRLFLHTDVLEGKLEQHPIFVLHCKKFDIYKDYAIGFNLIAADEYFIAFDYMGGKENTDWYSIDPVELEYASFPFALAWLFRRKWISRRIFEQHMIALAGLTRRRLDKLRRFINRKPGEDMGTQAESLGLRRTGYDDPLYEIRDEMLERFGEDVVALKAAGPLKLEAMEAYVSLLSLMKDQTLPVVAPEGLTLTPAFHGRQKRTVHDE